MDVNQLRQRIAVVNSTSAKLNEQRSRNIGMRETLEKQLADAIASYKTNFGIDLSQTDIGKELEALLSQKEAEVSLMEGVIADIEAGNYDSANARLNPVQQAETPMPSEQTPTQTVAIPIQTEQPVIQTIPEMPVNSALNLVGTVPPVMTVHAPDPVESGIVAPPVAPPQTPVQETAQPVLTPPVFGAPPSVGTPPVLGAPPVAPPTLTPPVGSKPVMPTVKLPDIEPDDTGLDMSALNGANSFDVGNKATDFSSLLSGTVFTPKEV